MAEHIKRIWAHPFTQRVWGISLGWLLAFSIVLGWYKNSIDTLLSDVTSIKQNMNTLQIDVAVLKNDVSSLKNKH